MECISTNQNIDVAPTSKEDSAREIWEVNSDLDSSYGSNGNEKDDAIDDGILPLSERLGEMNLASADSKRKTEKPNSGRNIDENSILANETGTHERGISRGNNNQSRGNQNIRRFDNDSDGGEWLPPGYATSKREPTCDKRPQTRGAIMIDLTTSLNTAKKCLESGSKICSVEEEEESVSAAAKRRMRQKKKQINRLLSQAKVFAIDLDWKASLEKYLSVRALLQQLGGVSEKAMSQKIAKKIRKARLKLGMDVDNEEISLDSCAKEDVLGHEFTVLDQNDGCGHDEVEQLCWDTDAVQGVASLTSEPMNSASTPAKASSAVQFSLPIDNYNKLFPHQRQGVKWMWSLYRNGHGGILADDMGLGKTVQVASLLHGMLTAKRHRVALVVCPLSVIPAWSRELRIWAPSLRVVVLHGMTSSKLTKAMALAVRKGRTVCVTTYGQVRSQVGFFSCGQHSGKGYGVWENCVQMALSDEHKASRLKKLKRRVFSGCKSTGRSMYNFQYCCVVLDEGQAIKNHLSKIAIAARKIPSRQRLILTGTPIQNNLTELWSLFDFISQRDHEKSEDSIDLTEDMEFSNEGLNLGSLVDFNLRIANSIEVANQSDATEQELRAGKIASQALAVKIRPFLLRRTKAGVFGERARDKDKEGRKEVKAPQMTVPLSVVNSLTQIRVGNEEESNVCVDTSVNSTGVTRSTHSNSTSSHKPCRLSKKLDIVVWLPLSSVQREIYAAFLKSKQVKLALNKFNSPLVAINVLRKICCHPALLHGEGAKEIAELLHMQKDGDKNLSEKMGLNVATKCIGDWMNSENFNRNKYSYGVETSCKLQFLLSLLPRLKDEGHRTLVFTSTRIMLDIIEQAVTEAGLTSIRIDGEIVSQERQKRVQRFNDEGEGDVMLLTIGVGGVGLTLTAASRVVLFSPDWNPTRDQQAIDRCFRIGQSKNVTAYRLITCNTVEESVYRRAVWKTGISSAVMKSNFSKAWSTKDELKRLFTLENPSASEFCDKVSHLRHTKSTTCKSDTIQDEEDILAQIGDREEEMACELGAYGVSFHELVCREPSIASYESVHAETEMQGKHRRSRSEQQVFDAPLLAPTTPGKAKDDYDALMLRGKKNTKQVWRDNAKKGEISHPEDFLELEAEEMPEECFAEYTQEPERSDESEIHLLNTQSRDQSITTCKDANTLELFFGSDSLSPVFKTPREKRREACIHTPRQYFDGEEIGEMNDQGVCNSANFEESVPWANLPASHNAKTDSPSMDASIVGLAIASTPNNVNDSELEYSDDPFGLDSEEEGAISNPMAKDMIQTSMTLPDREDEDTGSQNVRNHSCSSSSEESNEDDDDTTEECWVSPVSRKLSKGLANVCNHHREVMQRMFPPEIICSTKCRCMLREAELSKYKNLLDQAGRAQTNQMKLLILLDALEICDDDPALHIQILKLAKIEKKGQ